MLKSLYCSNLYKVISTKLLNYNFMNPFKLFWMQKLLWKNRGISCCERKEESAVCTVNESVIVE